MKKILSILLAFAMVGCMSIPAFAASSTNCEGSFSVNYSIQSSYSVYIPEEVTLNQQNYMTAELLNITQSEQLKVHVTNLNANKKLELTDEYGNTLEVSISNDGHIATFTDSMTSDIAYWAMDEGGKAGYYTGVIEFTIEVAPR